ncbi:hypothetical protein [Singulisphaera sp. PoT]|uniref:hypothetical protein n=1 Tax=Singulisphaera sp. PoT TaxID=3411797 RepID=UPI003BF46044
MTSSMTLGRPVEKTVRRRPAALARFGMVLAINGGRYRVRPIPCDRTAASRCFELRKEDETTYHVSQHVHGPECDCPDFIFHRAGIDPAGCKHIKALAAYGMVEPTRN